MATLPEPSNEQKLTYIYETLKGEEQRRKRRMWMKLLKWILLLTLIYLAYTYKAVIIEKSYGYIADRIQTEMKRFSEEQKSGILRGVQELLPSDLGDMLKKEIPQTPKDTKKPVQKSL